MPALKKKVEIKEKAEDIKWATLSQAQDKMTLGRTAFRAAALERGLKIYIIRGMIRYNWNDLNQWMADCALFNN